MDFQNLTRRFSSTLPQPDLGVSVVRRGFINRYRFSKRYGVRQDLSR